MKTMRQREPRMREPGYLKWLARQRCACGCFSGPPCHAAHLRASSWQYQKPITGIGTKPADQWALPLNPLHHDDLHRSGDELGWWRRHGVEDPFALCLDYYRRYQQAK